MDTGVKKNRRRSIRNIRRSSNFVPPSVTYGSAWIGENQDTNISNLVKSLEELNCHDGVDVNQTVNNCSHQNVHYAGDEARDGFSPAISNARVRCQNNTEYNKHEQNGLSGLCNFTPQSKQQSQKIFELSQDLMLSDVNAPGVDKSFEESEEIKRIVKTCTNHEISVQSNLESCSVLNTKYIAHQLNSVTETFCSSDVSADYATEKECSHYGSDCSVGDSESKTGEIQLGENSSIDGGYNCENSNKDMTQSSIHDEYLESSHKTLDNSMSPEFADFCPNSADSSPSINPMNQALTFLDATLGSVFNMSFSPDDVRPDTPKASTSDQQYTDSHSISKSGSANKMLDRSISSIIFSLDDSIISADPVISESILEPNSSNMSILPSVKSSTLPPVIQDIEHELDRTYTIDECVGDTEVTGDEVIIPIQSESYVLDISCSQPAMDNEQIIISEKDFVKSKRSSKRMSNLFTPMESNQLCTHSSEQSHKTSHEGDDCTMDCEKVDTTGDGVVCHLNSGSPSNIISETVECVVVEDNSSCSQYLSPVRATLTDCGNMIGTQEQTSAKKKRRKSNQLALLLKESERFVVQHSSNEQHGVMCPNGDKENDNSEESMDVHECQPDEDSRPRNVRTRRGRKSWDFRKESKAPSDVKSTPVKISDDYSSTELQDLETLYGKQKYVQESPRRLETIKEISEEKNVFLKKRVKRYLEFGSVTQAKGKKRMKKALSIYNGRQCYFPITEQEFDLKMLDVQLLLDS